MFVAKYEYGLYDGCVLKYKGTGKQLNQLFHTNVAFCIYVDKGILFKNKYRVARVNKDKPVVNSEQMELDDLQVILNHFEHYGNICYPKAKVDKVMNKLKSLAKFTMEESAYDKKYVILTKKG